MLNHMPVHSIYIHTITGAYQELILACHCKDTLLDAGIDSNLDVSNCVTPCHSAALFKPIIRCTKNWMLFKLLSPQYTPGILCKLYNYCTTNFLGMAFAMRAITRRNLQRGRIGAYCSESAHEAQHINKARFWVLFRMSTEPWVWPELSTDHSKWNLIVLTCPRSDLTVSIRWEGRELYRSFKLAKAASNILVL